MNKLKLILLTSTLLGLFACTSKVTETQKVGYLKNNISQTELQKRVDYKRYDYSCRNFETGSSSYLTSYFPLSKESRLKDNFGFYFQLDGGKPQPFDHIENKVLNASGSRFEVVYRSYTPIEGYYINLIASEGSSIYYKNSTPWLECRES
ncbi:hypothetical protein BMT54_00025 [Pasteurellaceae bacterium 15-036681]|nr:hypothetical protein BMT54_00025 [Pasteurellaceae bacterium 15-036681]